MSEKAKNIFKYSIIISIAIFSSRILGMLREIIQVNYIGLNTEFSAYTSALLIPNILRELLAEGAFSTAFIAVFAGMINKKSNDEILTFVNKTLLISFLLSILISVILFFVSPFLMPLIHKNKENIDLTVELFRILLPFIIIMSISSIFMGFLNSYNKFGIPAWAPFISNIAYILIVVFFKDNWGIYTLAIAVLGGGIAQFLFQFPSFFKTGYRPRLLNLKFDEDLKKFFSLFLPFTLTMAIPMLYTVVTNPIATSVSEYGNGVLRNSFVLVRFVLSIVALSIGIVSLPNLSRHYANEEHKDFTRILTQALGIIIIITIPVVSGAMLLSERVSSFVWRDITFGIFGNKISDKNISEIAKSLLLYSPGILFSSMNAIIQRSYQSMKIWKTPLIVGAITVIVHYILSLVFSKTALNYQGIALSFSIVSIINFIVLFIILQMKVKVKIAIKSDLLPSIIKSLISSGVMISVLFVLEKLIGNPTLFGNIYLNRTAIFLSLFFIGIIIYFLLMILLREKTTHTLFSRLFKRKANNTELR